MKCKQCNEELIGKREGALYCNPNCKQKYFKRKKIILSQIDRLKKQFESNNKSIFSLTFKIIFEKKNINEKITKIKEQLIDYRRQYNEWKRVSELSPQEFFNELANDLLNHGDQYPNQRSTICFGDTEKNQQLRNDYLKAYLRDINVIVGKHNALRKQLTYQKRLLKEFDGEELKRKQAKLESENVNITKQLKELESFNLDRLPPIISLKAKKTKTSNKTSMARAYSAREILNMDFNGVQLRGKLGKFIGNIQRIKCAIALTGDSGAGKSTFSYDLANAFLEQNLSVAYFSLEMGFTPTTKKLIKKHQMTGANFMAFDEGKLDDIRTEAQNFDCIVIDSYSKISSKAQDFENLRQDFPKTVFIVIFQKTTDGKIRGGSSIVFNCTTAIDIQVTKDGHRIALNQKSRYGTENFVYSITEEKLLKETNLPIDWIRIKKEWPRIDCGIAH